jgi:hypothetical protein
MGLKPEEVRDLIPRDAVAIWSGWNRAHAPKRPGSDAPTREEYHAMLRQIDGNHR